MKLIKCSEFKGLGGNDLDQAVIQKIKETAGDKFRDHGRLGPLAVTLQHCQTAEFGPPGSSWVARTLSRVAVQPLGVQA